MFKKFENYSFLLGALIFVVSAVEVAFTLPLALCIKITFGGEPGNLERTILAYLRNEFGVTFDKFIVLSWVMAMVSVLLGFLTVIVQQWLLWMSHAKLVSLLLDRISVSKNWDGLGHQYSRIRKVILTEVQNYSMFWLASRSNIFGRGLFIIIFFMSIFAYYFSEFGLTEKILLFASASLLGGIFFILKKVFRTKGMAREVVARRIFAVTDEILQNMRVIKILGRNDFFQEKIWREVSDFRKISLQFGILPHIPRMIIELLIFTFLATFILASTDTIATSEIYFVLAFLRLLPSMNILLRNVADLGLGRAAKFELNQLYYMATQKNHRKEDPNILVNLDQLNKVLSDEKQDYNIILVKGKSGSGKTTLLNNLLLDNQKLRSVLSYDENHRRIGYVPQDVFLINGDVYQNIAFGKQINREVIDELLVDVGLAHFVGRSVIFDVNGGELSGGERQRVGIARCLYSEVNVILMDEPTAALDRETENKIANLIRKLALEGVDFMIVTHSDVFDLISSATLELEKV